MNKYKFLIVDAQLVLTRNFSAVRGLDYFSQELLVANFLYSINKANIAVGGADKIILIWDKAPYHKIAMLDDYKGDRFYATDEDVAESVDEITRLKGLYDVELDPVVKQSLKDQIIELQKKADDLENQVRVNKIKGSSKYFIITKFNSLGMPSFLRQGYEADDLAMLISKKLKEESHDKPSCLYTNDGDWMYFTHETLDYYHLNRERFYDHLHIKNEVGDIDPYVWKTYQDSLAGSHNNLTRVITPEADKLSWKDLITKLHIEKDDPANYVTDVKLFSKQFESFDVHSYPDIEKVQQMFYYLDKSGSIMEPNEFRNWCMMNALNISANKYNELVQNLNRDLYE